MQNIDFERNKQIVCPAGTEPYGRISFRCTETTLEVSTTIATQYAAAINYTPSGRMAATTVQGALDEIAGDFFVQDSTPSGSQLNEGDLWYDTDDDEIKVYRESTWQTLAGAGGTAETMLTLDGGSF